LTHDDDVAWLPSAIVPSQAPSPDVVAISLDVAMRFARPAADTRFQVSLAASGGHMYGMGRQGRIGKGEVLSDRCPAC
jgi:hypothetical protein